MKRAIIFANGAAGDYESLRREITDSDLLVCADGGALHTQKLGILPTIVIGDMDSLEKEKETFEQLRQTQVEFKRFPAEKDETDLELALDYALDKKCNEILIACPFGGRVDHLLGNILLISQPKYASIRIYLSDGLQRAVLLRAKDEIVLSRDRGNTLSLIPLSPSVQGVCLSGVKWPLNDAILSFGNPISISNEIVSENALVKITNGILLAVQTANPA